MRFKAAYLGAVLFLAALPAHAADMTLSSPTVTDGKTMENAQIFNGWGCTGENHSPALKWSDAPEGTKSFALTMYDPDAPTGSGWWHWAMIDIPANVDSLPEGAGAKDSKELPTGAIQLRNDFGFVGYGGACPPPDSKPHNYTITVYALNVDKLDVPADASPAYAGFYILQHKIGEAKLIAPTNAR